MFNEFYKDKIVLVTGHTGFKGSWLCAWLVRLGARVVGFSDEIPTSPSLFEMANIKSFISHEWGDIRDHGSLERVMQRYKPQVVFHLAAQAIVSESYKDPMRTVTTNVCGTANMLTVMSDVNWPCSLVLITSDKCYENREWCWGYRELDRLGGNDVYSASKAAAELLFNAYFESFHKKNSDIRTASARAGNVIGGGDWSKDRVVVDSIKAWSQGKPIHLRMPRATRPWQHVLEPLSGYLLLGKEISENKYLSGLSFNLGPRHEEARTVSDLIKCLGAVYLDTTEQLDGKWIVEESQRCPTSSFYEAGLLQLDCSKAKNHLRWEATLQYSECLQLVGSWYRRASGGENPIELLFEQLDYYEALAAQRGRVWAV